MMNTMRIVTSVLLGLLSTAVVVSAVEQKSDSSYGHGEEAALRNGVIGVSLQLGAERIGDPAVLYVAMVHPEGPAHQAGLVHGDEILTIDGNAVSGKSYEQIVRMIRGEAGTAVKLGVKGEGAVREVTITRMNSEKLPKGLRRSHGEPAR